MDLVQKYQGEYFAHSRDGLQQVKHEGIIGFGCFQDNAAARFGHNRAKASEGEL